MLISFITEIWVLWFFTEFFAKYRLSSTFIAVFIFLTGGSFPISLWFFIHRPINNRLNYPEVIWNILNTGSFYDICLDFASCRFLSFFSWSDFNSFKLFAINSASLGQANGRGSTKKVTKSALRIRLRRQWKNYSPKVFSYPFSLQLNFRSTLFYEVLMIL